ncbi:transposase [Saccharomonospora piscinae]|nr:transposase [Saccharomonospora piscinae]
MVAEGLWARIEPLLTARPAGRTGPKPLPDRAVLQGHLSCSTPGSGWRICRRSWGSARA